MSGINSRILIMAGGTGGHIFPALAIAEALQLQGIQVDWLGSKHGMENALVHKAGIPLHRIAARGIAGKGLIRLLMAPFMIVTATFQALRIVRTLKPDCVLGLGGFVSGPGGLAAWLNGRPLLIHEQNAVAGITNRFLSRLAFRILESFAGTFPGKAGVIHTGNPVRAEILALHGRNRDIGQSHRPLRILVLGGSQGAKAINQVIPEMLTHWPPNERPQIRHQTGPAHLEGAMAMYRDQGIETGNGIEIQAFIEDMGSAFSWADLVIARSGASTVCELAVAGLPSVLIPYPWHRDQQQLRNATWLLNAGAALIVQQHELSSDRLAAIVRGLDINRERILAMSESASKAAIVDATQRIVNQCKEAVNV